MALRVKPCKDAEAPSGPWQWPFALSTAPLREGSDAGVASKGTAPVKTQACAPVASCVPTQTLPIRSPHVPTAFPPTRCSWLLDGSRGTIEPLVMRDACSDGRRDRPVKMAIMSTPPGRKTRFRTGIGIYQTGDLLPLLGSPKFSFGGVLSGCLGV